MANIRPCRHPEVTKRMVENDFSWPGLLLPMKRYVDNVMECGYLCNPSEGNKVRVYLGNMCRPNDNDPKLEYASVDDLILAGWEVD